jgi:hypothetical protein
MRRLGTVLVLFAFACGACASKEPPPAVAPAAPPTSAAAPSEDPNRVLTESECESLAQSLVDTCDKRGNAHSLQLDRWCSDLAHAVTDGSWVAKTCVPRVRFIDAKCFESATNVTAAMDCERNVAP